MLYAGRVINMSQNLMFKGRLQLFAALIEQSELLSRKIIKAVTVGTNKVGENRPRDDGILMFQPTDELVHILFGVKAKSVHTGIELDVDRPTRNTLFLSRLNQSIEQTERVHLRLKVEVEHRLES